ncbi:MAG TPA: GFA family protein [Stellaceae bacterium]|nr:GFA family protein [Stellaceae bacterium]
MSENPPPFRLTGGCQCGAVRYELTAPPERVHLCHCRMCQKAVGGPFAVGAPVRRSAFAWTRGTPASFASSSLAQRDFCPRCGTPLTFRYDDADTISVTVGSLDRPQDVPPVRHYGVEGRLGWLDRLASLPVETTDEMMPAARRARYVNYQHPDRDTPPDWSPPR